MRFQLVALLLVSVSYIPTSGIKAAAAGPAATPSTTEALDSCPASPSAAPAIPNNPGAATNPTVAATPLTPSTPVVPADDDFAPGPLLAVLALLLLVVIAAFLAVAVGLFLLAAGAVLLLLGIVSSSALAGLVARTRGGSAHGTAFRTFVVQASAIVAVPLGVLATWLEHRLLHMPLSHRAILLIGGPGGLIVGAGMGFLFCLAAERVVRFLTARIRPRDALPALPDH